MTYEELKRAEKLAANREHMLKVIEDVRNGTFHQGLPWADHENPRAFGYGLDKEAVEALRAALIGEMERRIAEVDGALKKLGVVFPEPAPQAKAKAKAA